MSITTPNKDQIESPIARAASEIAIHTAVLIVGGMTASPAVLI
jgi:hypothetical protein